MATSLLVGMEDRDSAKRRRQDEYRQDLELQMREKDAAKQRERLQGMSVDASGWLDPEKRPERLKPLGGVHWTQQKGRRNERVRPYHTLFLYGKVPRTSGEMVTDKSPRVADYDLHVDGGKTRPFTVNDDGGEEQKPNVRPTRTIKTPPGLRYQPLTYAGAGVNPGNSVDQAYNFTGRNVGYGNEGRGSLVQPVTMPYPDTRPIIVTGGGGGGYQPPRTIVEYRDDGTSRELRNLLGQVQSEKDKMRRDNDEFQRKLRRDMEDEKRRINDQENEARRRLDNLRREAEENRRLASRQRREAERLRREAENRPRSHHIRPASKKTVIYYDMDDYRQRLIEERRRMEELLKATKPISNKDMWDLKVVPRPRFRLNLPPTPNADDNANQDNVREFNNLKFRDFDERQEFRHTYPDVPITNRRLEQQQEALLAQQVVSPDKGYHTERPRERRKVLEIEPRRAMSRPGWLDRSPTPFPHQQKKWEKRYSEYSCECDEEEITRRRQERERLQTMAVKQSSRRREDLKLRDHRPLSSETLTDDTWIRPSYLDVAYP